MGEFMIISSLNVFQPTFFLQASFADFYTSFLAVKNEIRVTKRLNSPE